MFFFPIDNVQILIGDKKLKIKESQFTDDFIQVSSDEISIDIEKVAYYFIKQGKQIIITPYSSADDQEIQDQLEKWGVMSILHQRQLLNFHAGSVNIAGQGIMISGDTGAGKSSLTAALSLGDGAFLNDDITAISFPDEEAMIIKYGHSISLFTEILRELKPEGFKQDHAYKPQFKYDIKWASNAKRYTPLKYIIHLSIHENGSPVIREIQGHEKFSLLRGNICSWEMLKGIPGLEEKYMEQLLRICDTTPVFSVKRPLHSDLKGIVRVITEQIPEICFKV